MKKYRLISIILIICLILTNNYTVNAFVNGESGNVSPGESINAYGGINWLVYKVCIVDMEGKNQLSGENILKYTDTEQEIEQKFKRHYAKKFPRIADYTLFIESDGKESIWMPNAYLSEYNPCDTSLKPVDRAIKNKKLHRLFRRHSSNPGNIFYNNLRNEIKSARDLRSRSKTDKDWWKRVYNNTANKETNSKKLWNYILGRESGIENRIAQYTESSAPEGSEENILEIKLKYLDLLLTLYTLDETLRDDLEKLLPNYIYDIDLLKKPLLLSIEAGVRVSSDLWKPVSFSYMSCTDYFMYYYGATQGKTIYDDITDVEYDRLNNTRCIFEKSYQSSYKTLPGIIRLSEKFQSQTHNPFSWGISGVMNGYFHTKKGTVIWDSRKKTGLMDGLKFTPNQVGFILIGAKNNKQIPSPNLTLEMKASIGPDNQKEYIVPPENDVIGVNTYIDVTLTQADIDNWKTIIGNPDIINYDLKLTLTSTLGTIDKLDTQAPNINTKIINISKQTLLNILDSNHAFRYQEDLTSTPIAEEQNIKIGYSAKLEIDYELNFKKNHLETQIAEDHVIAKRGKKPIPKTGQYTSNTEVFSEIKQGTPGKEKFEAMAGVPTTRNLYFSSGGAEYIVDVAVEFHTGQKTKRKYTSLFHSVPSQNNMPVINNAWNKDKPLPKPTPRFKIDHMGTKTVENIAQETRPYLKYKSISSKNGSWSRASVSAPEPRISTAWDGTTRSETTGTGSTTIIDKPAVPAKKNKDGKVIRKGQPAITHKEYRQEWYGFGGENSTEYRWVQQGHNKKVGGYSETWEQTITYDYLEITDVAVYEISESIVDGMQQITSTDKIKGTIVQGKPSVFYNVDDTNTSRGGRLIYSLETTQNDHVTWDEGNSDNAENNMTNSGNVNEDEIWKNRKETLNNVTVVSDFLILQTTQGDKSIVYFDQTSESKQTQEDITLEKSSLDEQWNNNPTCAAKWEADALEISGYTGNYKNVDKAHSDKKTDNFPTAHDPNNTSVNRPARPSKPLRLTKTSIDIIDDLPNSEYITGNSKVFYEKVAPSKGSPFIYLPEHCSDFGKTGLEYKSPYSSNHTKINDIVVHNPVSAQDAILISLPDTRDQRTKASLPKNMALDSSITEYDRVLVEVPSKPQYKNVKVPNPKFKKLKIVENENYIPGKYIPRKETFFSYTGQLQTYKAPIDGEYTLEVWGAQGGNGAGGYGGYSKGKINLTKNENLYILVGGSNGFNGGGSGHGRSYQCGGGATDIRRNTNSLYNRIIVAGGGGGRGDSAHTYSRSSGYGGAGGGITGNKGGDRCGHPGNGGSQTSGGSGGSNGGSSGTFGTGGRNRYGSSSGGGGGGGGYYGGGAGGNDYSSYNDNDDSGGGGGSGYIGNLKDGITSSGVRSGNGYAKIVQEKYKTKGIGKKFIIIPGSKDETISNPNHSVDETEPPYITVKGTGEPEFIDKKVLVSGGAKTSYEYKLVPRKMENKPVSDDSGNTYNPGNFINVDYGFQIYYPNKGDFYGNGASGIDTTTFVRGKGYTENMNTTEWTKNKSVTFPFSVIYNNVMYRPMKEIPLEVNKSTFDFYLPLSVREAVSAEIKFIARANNCDYYDATSYTNRVRTHNKEAKHSAYKNTYIDVVGRIGNLVIEDTGDWRFSNIFKEPIIGKWYIDNVVPKVDNKKQQNIMSDKIDIRGMPVASKYNFLDTYGSIPNHNLNPIEYPLTPSLNPIKAIRRQPQRLGYLNYMDISSIGNYNKIQIIPYYYNLSLTDGTIIPLDIYMNTGASYEPINIFDIVKPNWDSSNIYLYKYFIDWPKEKVRRCVSTKEEQITESVLQTTKRHNYNEELVVKDSPYGYMYSGTAQQILLGEKNRTYIGTSITNTNNKNPGNKIPEVMYSMNGQRWHFNVGLPSSAISVPHNKPFSENNIIANNNSVIVMALDIKVAGEVYNLQYKHPNKNVNISGKEYDLSSIPYNVITIYSTNKSSAEDLDIIGTH